MTPNRQPQRTAPDPAPDEVCRPPAWISEALHRAKLLGLHANQRRQVAILLGWIEVEEFDLPRFWFVGKHEVDAVVCLWAGNGRLVEAGLHWSASMGWRTKLSTYEGKRQTRSFWPAHPAAPLREMLAGVDPEAFEGRKERR